jgi:hypothetical protein
MLNGAPVLYLDETRGSHAARKSVFTRTLMQIVVILTATAAMKALSLYYDFSWTTALTAG